MIQKQGVAIFLNMPLHDQSKGSTLIGVIENIAALFPLLSRQGCCMGGFKGPTKIEVYIFTIKKRIQHSVKYNTDKFDVKYLTFDV